MSEFTVSLIIISSFISTFLIVVIGLSKSQLKKSERLINKIDLTKYQKANIKFRQATSSKGKITTGVYTKCNMIFNKNTMIIVPKEKSYFNILFSKLPIIIAKNKEEYEKSISSFDIVIPDKIKITSWDLLIIEFNKQKLLNVKYDLSIKFNSKSDIEEFKEIYLAK